MFKLDHLEISGFKSFVDPVSVKFTGSLNAIVGPNGCGKSNVSDAVTWVLGERSAKTLRASRMEDVIFSGSQSRKPLGMAEVTLSLLADASVEEAEDGVLVIGRRLYRSGESQYLINGKVARLKEIRSLLMGTGLGIRAYSVIEQGKIDAVLSGKPQERRRLLEEAAGITKYKERKRLAELKLEEATSNLARIDDIVSEVERSLRSLKRQANAARRYGSRKTEYDTLLEKLYLKRHSLLSDRLGEMTSALEKQRADEARLVAELHRAEADEESGRQSVDSLAETYAELRQRDAEIQATIEGKQEIIRGSRDLLSELSERLQSGEQRAEQRRAEIEGLLANQRAYEEIHASTSSETATAARVVDETDSEMERTDAALRQAERRQEAVRSDLLAALGEVNSLRNQLHQLSVESEKGSFRATHLKSELGERRSALEAARRDAERGREALESLRGANAERETERSDMADELRELGRRLEGLDGRLGEGRQRSSALEQRHELLSELAQAQQDKRRHIGELLHQAGHGEAEFLGDRVSIPAGWERSVDLYLAEIADAVVLPAGSDALAAGEAVASGRGTTRFLLATDNGAPPAVEDPAIVSSLAEAVELPAPLAHALPAAYLVEAPADAVRLARAHPGVAFLSRERLWAQSGLVHVQAEEAEPGALAREKEIVRLREVRSKLADELRQLDTERRRAAEQRTELETSLEAATATLDESRRRLAVAEARQEDLEAAERRLTIECETLDSERQEIGRELDRVGATVEEVRSRLDATETRHAELESEFDNAQRAVESARDQREEARTSGASRRGQLNLLQERLESHQQGLERIRSEIASHRDQLGSWKDEKESLGRRQVDVGERLAAAEKELQTALEARTGSEEALRRQEEGLRDARGTQLGLERSVREMRHELEGVRESLSERRVAEAGLRQESEHLAANYREHFERDLPESFERPEEAVEELEVDVERMRNLLHRMGPINELAAEEYTEQEERHEFLTTQRKDVIESVERLRSTIREINETSSQRFLETFERVNEGLGETFRELFNGGEAEMRLLDEDDLLDSGIEIVARPPGKRLQNIMLLSGGEKALTALALLFALFRTKPSPFCILDEVDAPLDDVNTLRFVGLLKKMSRQTQFVLITHNKLTMAAASALYGVTMEERGVSRIVSVELDEIHPQEEAASA